MIQLAQEEAPLRRGTCLFHYNISPCNNLSKGLSIPRHVYQFISKIVAGTYNPDSLCRRKCMSLSSHKFGPLLQRQLGPQWLRIIARERPIRLIRPDDYLGAMTLCGITSHLSRTNVNKRVSILEQCLTSNRIHARDLFPSSQVQRSNEESVQHQLHASYREYGRNAS